MYIVQKDEVAIVLKHSPDDEDSVLTKLVTADGMDQEKEEFLLGILFHMLSVLALTESDEDNQVMSRLNELAREAIRQDEQDKLTETSAVAGSA